MAILVAQACGQSALQAVLQRMSDAALAPQLSPLHIFGLAAAENWQGAVDALSGSQHDRSHTAGSSPGKAALSPAGSGAAANAANAHLRSRQGAASPQRKVLVPQGTGASAQPPLCAWHATLLMLAAHRTPADAVALGALGDRLWHAPAQSAVHAADSESDSVHRDRAAAHVCYVLAGRAAESAYAADSCFVLPGADHHGRPRSLLAADVLQRADMLAWCLQQSMGTPMYCMIPHYLAVRKESSLWRRAAAVA